MKSRQNKIQLNVEIPKYLHRKIKIDAAVHDVSIKDWMRRALHFYCYRRNKIGKH